MRLPLLAVLLAMITLPFTNGNAQSSRYCYAGSTIKINGSGETLVMKSIDDIDTGATLRFTISPLVNRNAYLVTDECNTIVKISTTNFLPIDDLEVGTYRIWAFNYIGRITAEEGQNAAEAELASFCYELTSNFVLLDITNGAPFTVQILHHNDGESSLINAGGNFPEVGGAANFKQVVDELRFTAFDNGYPSVLFSAGDNFLPGPEFTAGQQRTDGGPGYDALLMGSLGYDAVALGNHDFDFGPDVLEQFIKDTDFSGTIGSTGTTTTTIETINFLSEFNIPSQQDFEGNFFGGVSGIHYNSNEDVYYMISDDPDNPRYYTANITITDDAITDVNVLSVTTIKDETGEVITNGHSDPESIRLVGGLGTESTLIWANEGNINLGYEPSVREMALDGSYIRDFAVPSIFLNVDEANNQGPRQNGAFESIAVTTDGSEVITAMELPLRQDGPTPALEPTNSPVRFLFFDRSTGEPTRQYAYQLEPLALSGTIFATNGVVEILPLDENSMLVVERSAFFNEGESGNIIKVFKANIDDATDVSALDSLSGADYVPMTKELVLLIDFDAANFANPIDNIEGITFGPLSSNGNRTLLLASDDNFSAFGPQSNQFLLYEIDLTTETSEEGETLELMGPPFVSANLSYEEEPGLQALADANRIRTSTQVFRGSESLGVIGLTTSELPFISSPRRTTVMSDLVAAVEAEVASLKERGVNKFILLSHLQGIGNEIELAGQLQDIDIIVAGGGNEFLSNNPLEDEIPGLVDSANVRGSYPMELIDAKGKTVYLVAAPGGYTYLGNLTVTFSSNGLVVDVDEISGPVKVITDKPDEDMQALIVDPVSDYVADLANNILATTEVEINGVTEDVRTKETNGGNLIADALLWQANLLAGTFGVAPADVAIQNGGGIRNSVVVPAEGEISELTTFNMLPFPNFVTIVEDIPATQFKRILERAVSGVEGFGGRFAQIAGFELVYDPNGQAQEIDEIGNLISGGSRVVEVKLANGRFLVRDGQVVEDAPSVRIATIDFLARGGDAYPYDGALFTSLGVSYQQALANYLTSGLPANNTGFDVTAAQYPSGGEGRIQTVITEGLQALLPQTNVVRSTFQMNVSPNPVQAEIDIAYEVATDNQVDIVLSDLSGRPVQTIFSGFQQAGMQRQSVNIGSLALPKGTYLVSLRIGNQIQAQTIIKD